jgi:hypothetical protein
MKVKFHIARPVAWWSGATLLLIGLILASVATIDAVRSRDEFQDPEKMAAELRANGAIVENYYKILEDRYPRLSPRPLQSPAGMITIYLAAGLLTAAGSILIWKASSARTFPRSRQTNQGSNSRR